MAYKSGPFAFAGESSRPSRPSSASSSRRPVSQGAPFGLTDAESMAEARRAAASAARPGSSSSSTRKPPHETAPFAPTDPSLIPTQAARPASASSSARKPAHQKAPLGLTDAAYRRESEEDDEPSYGRPLSSSSSARKPAHQKAPFGLTDAAYRRGSAEDEGEEGEEEGAGRPPSKPAYQKAPFGLTDPSLMPESDRRRPESREAVSRPARNPLLPPGDGDIVDMIVGDNGVVLSMKPRTKKTTAHVTTMNLLLEPGLERKLEYMKRGTKEKNHLSENVKKLREAQARERQRKQELEEQAQSASKPRPVSRQYAHVSSKVKQALAEPPQREEIVHGESGEESVDGQQDTRKQPQFLRRHSKSGRPSTPESPVVTRPSTTASQALSVSGTAKSSRPSSSQSTRTAGTGEVPAYLVARKEQWRKEAAERAAQTADPNCPPGHVALPDAERREALDMHKANLEQLMSEVGALSISSTTLRARRHREELEQRISETEDAIKFFSRPKVYVRKDE